MKAVVTGANRGIGLEFCRQLKEKGFDVVAVCRRSSEALKELGCEVVTDVDVTSDEALKSLSEQLGATKIDWLINNAGILRSTSLEPLDEAAIREQFEVNALAPLRVTLALRSQLGQGSKVGMVTSRMGSMTDNSSGGAYGYRMSKAALNAASVSLAHDLKPEGIAVAILHPGWVRTEMTGGSGLIDADESASGLIKTLENLNLENSGCFWHTNGEELEW